MRGHPHSFRFGVSAAACVTLALMVLVLPIKWILSALLAAAFHELCHMAAARLCGSRISGLNVGGGGAVLTSEPMSRGRELFCVLAGPIGGLMLLFFSRWIPRTAVCAAFQSLYNLLPMEALDGGRALRCVSERLLPDMADTICAAAEWVCLIAIGILALYAAFFLRLGPLPLVASTAVWLRAKKDLANRCGSGYNRS